MEKNAIGSAADAEVDIVPSGEALRVASGWLGMTSEEALQEGGPSASSQIPTKRPQFLGLGAKYLPHHKAVETASALDFKLRKRLERGLAVRRLAEEEEREEGARGAAAPRGLPASRGAPLSAARSAGGGTLGMKRSVAGGGQDFEGEDVDSDDEERKASVMAGGKAAGGGPGAGIALGSKAAREAALLYAPVDGGGKRKKAKGSKQQ